MEVVLVVRLLNEEDELIGGYVGRELYIPFVPIIGMKFKQGTSTWLWETDNGELEPSVKEVVYNIDEEVVYCLFEVKESLKSSFWKPIENINVSFELSQFGIRS